MSDFDNLPCSPNGITVLRISLIRHTASMLHAAILWLNLCCNSWSCLGKAVTLSQTATAFLQLQHLMDKCSWSKDPPAHAASSCHCDCLAGTCLHAKYKKVLTLAKELAGKCSVMGNGQWSSWTVAVIVRYGAKGNWQTDISQVVQDEETDSTKQNQAADSDVESADSLTVHDDDNATQLESDSDEIDRHNNTGSTTKTATDAHETAVVAVTDETVQTSNIDTSSQTVASVQIQRNTEEGVRFQDHVATHGCPRSLYNGDWTKIKEKC